MIVGTLSPLRCLVAAPDSPIRITTSPSVDTLLCDMLSSRCDVAVIPGSGRPTEIEAALAGVCFVRPVTSVWITDSESRSFTPVASGECGTDRHNGRGGALTVGSVSAIRPIWLNAWSRWIGAAVQEANGILMQRELPARCFLEALVRNRVPDLGSALGRGQRDLQNRLADLGLRGPKRFLMAARVFTAWEWVRIGAWSIEKTAHYLGFASLSSMDHTFASSVGVRPREVASMTDSEVLRLLVAAVRRGGSDQKLQLAAGKV